MYVANEMLGAGVSATEVGKATAAKVFLRKLIAKGDKIRPRSLADEFEVAGAGDEFKLQMQKMIQAERDRIAGGGGTPNVPKQLPSGDTPRPEVLPKPGGSPKQTGSFLRRWRDGLTDDAKEYATFSAGRGAPSLGQGPFHWEELVNFACADEWGHGETKDAHFFTAVAQKLATMPEVVAMDESGSRDIAILVGMEELAHEWLGNLYTEGVRLMGSGATFEQVRFSPVALKGLFGGGAKGARPEHLVCFFAQVAAAAARHQQSLPMKKGNPGRQAMTAGEGSSSVDDSALSQEEIDTITQHHLDEAPAGVQRETVRRAVMAQAGKAGSGFRGKQLTYYGDFHGGKAASGGDKLLEGLHVLSPGYRLAMAHVTLASDCAREARVTAGTALDANLQSPEAKKRIHALIARKFSDGNWKASYLLPRVTRGRNVSLQMLAKGFGAFEKCETSDDFDARGNAETDSVLCRCARGVITWMRVLDTTSCDDGFRTELIFWLTELEGFQAVGAPFYLIGCQLGTLLTESDQHRQRSLMFRAEGEEGDSLSFTPTPEMQAGKEALLAMTRRQFQTDRIVMAAMDGKRGAGSGASYAGAQKVGRAARRTTNHGKGKGGGKGKPTAAAAGPLRGRTPMGKAPMDRGPPVARQEPEPKASPWPQPGADGAGGFVKQEPWSPEGGQGQGQGQAEGRQRRQRAVAVRHGPERQMGQSVRRGTGRRRSRTMLVP